MILARLVVIQILLTARSLFQNVSDRVKKDHSRAILLFKVLSTKMLFVIEIVGCSYIQKYIDKRKTISKFLPAIQNLQNNYHLNYIPKNGPPYRKKVVNSWHQTMLWSLNCNYLLKKGLLTSTTSLFRSPAPCGPRSIYHSSRTWWTGMVSWTSSMTIYVRLWRANIWPPRRTKLTPTSGSQISLVLGILMTEW